MSNKNTRIISVRFNDEEYKKLKKVHHLLEEENDISAKTIKSCIDWCCVDMSLKGNMSILDDLMIRNNAKLLNSLGIEKLYNELFVLLKQNEILLKMILENMDVEYEPELLNRLSTIEGDNNE